MMELTGTYPGYSHACNCHDDMGLGLHVYFFKDGVSFINNDKMQGLAMTYEDFRSLIEIYQKVFSSGKKNVLPALKPDFAIASVTTIEALVMSNPGLISEDDRSEVAYYNNMYGSNFNYFMKQQIGPNTHREIWGVVSKPEAPLSSECFKIVPFLNSANKETK